MTRLDMMPKRSTLRSRAHAAVAQAINDGRLQSPSVFTCTDCGRRTATSYDHRSYLRPLDVSPVCRSCNSRRGPAAPLTEGECGKVDAIRLVRTIIGIRVTATERNWLRAQARAKGMTLSRWIRMQVLPRHVMETGVVSASALKTQPTQQPGAA